MLWYCTFEYLYVDKHKYLRTPSYLLLFFVYLCHPPLSPALTLCPWCALFQPRQEYQSMNKWLESFVTKGLSFLSLLHKYLWSRHTNRLMHRAQTFTLWSSTEQAMHMHWPAGSATVKNEVCVYVCDFASVCMWKDQRYLCRRDRNDTLLVTKLSNHLCMD